MQDSFFEIAGPGRYRATSATAWPWSPNAQHGGPPSALAARELERHEPDEHMRLARVVAIDILRLVPVGELTSPTWTLRPGRRVTLLETVLESVGQPVLHARGGGSTLADGPVVHKNAMPVALPAIASQARFPDGYVDG